MWTQKLRKLRQATTSEDTADWEDLLRAVVNCRVCELVKVLQLHVVNLQVLQLPIQTLSTVTHTCDQLAPYQEPLGMSGFKEKAEGAVGE
jgi:hypothetical protein